MRIVFADTSYWVAFASPKDQWRAVALQTRQALGDIQILTTEEVLTEFLDHLSGRGAAVREAAAEMIHAVLEADNVVVLLQSDKT